jgi:hypothetical protein
LGNETSTMRAPASRSHCAPRVHSVSISEDMPSSLYSLGMPIVRPFSERPIAAS